MANGFRNWSYDDLAEFLNCHNIYFHKELGGSHSSWVSRDGLNTVEVNMTKGSYPELTLLTDNDRKLRIVKRALEEVGYFK